METGFQSFEELCDNIARGGEIEFEYNNKKYSITHSNRGIHVMAFHDYNTEVIYKLAIEIGEYSIESKKLKDVITDIVIHFRCF